MKPIWKYASTWFAVMALALLLALASPRHAVGRLPPQVGQTVAPQVQAAAQGSQRVIALVTFKREQRPEAESWIQGLQLDRSTAIPWVRMPVLADPGNEGARAQAQGRILVHYTKPEDRARLVPVITDREAFLQSTGMPDASSAYVLVLNSEGDVLARVQGAFDETKAQAVRDTLEAWDL